MVGSRWRRAVGVVGSSGAAGAVQPGLEHLGPALGLLRLVLAVTVLRPLAVLGQALHPDRLPVLILALFLLHPLVLDTGVVDDVVRQVGKVRPGDGIVGSVRV